MTDSTRTVTTESTDVFEYDVFDHGLLGTVKAEIRDGMIAVKNTSEETQMYASIPVEMGDVVCRILGKMRDEGDVPTTEEST